MTVQRLYYSCVKDRAEIPNKSPVTNLADGSHRDRVFTGFYRFIRTHASYLKIRCKLDTEMFHHEFWKPTYFGVKRSKVKVIRHKKQCWCGFVTLVSAGFF